MVLAHAGYAVGGRSVDAMSDAMRGITMQASLPEELLLLALHDEKGSVIPAAASVLDGALVGAILMELGLQGRLREDVDGALQVDPTPTGDEILDEALQRIS